MSRRAGRLTAAMLVVVTVAACSSSNQSSAPTVSLGADQPSTLAQSVNSGATIAAPAATSTTTQLPTTTSTTTTTSTATTTATSLVPVTSLLLDPSRGDIPVGTCDTIMADAIGYRNDTGAVATQQQVIGTSSQGRAVWAEHWGNADGPQVLVLGQVHGDECAPAWFVRAIREQPPTSFGIWLVPTMNPDGLAAHTRRTAGGVDPNRDGFRLETPEARAVMDATERFQPVLTIHVHSPYQWIGAHNGGIATRVAKAMSNAVGWGAINNAGRVNSGDRAFLWEGQELVIAGHPSVLIEFPAVADAESPAPPDPSQKRVTTVDDVASLAALMRDALYAVIGTL